MAGDMPWSGHATPGDRVGHPVGGPRSQVIPDDPVARTNSAGRD
jgi:hypothetical protein